MPSALARFKSSSVRDEDCRFILDARLPPVRGSVVGAGPTRVPRGRSRVLRLWRSGNTVPGVKTLTVRLPEPLAAEIETESRARQMSKSDVVRERLQRAHRPRRGNRRSPIDGIADLIGSVDGLPADLSARKKAYLKSMRYGETRPR